VGGAFFHDVLAAGQGIFDRKILKNVMAFLQQSGDE
jgi:hypothetical protein